MARIRVVGNAVVVTSDLKVEEIERVKKFTTTGLKLKDEKGNEIFAINYKKGSDSSISEYGVTYGEVNADGYAQATFLMDEHVVPADRVEVLLDSFGIAIGNLNALENYIREAAIELNNTVEDIKNAIEVID